MSHEADKLASFDFTGCAQCFWCDVCYKPFTTKWSLNRHHKRIHEAKQDIRPSIPVEKPNQTSSLAKGK